MQLFVMSEKSFYRSETCIIAGNYRVASIGSLGYGMNYMKRIANDIECHKRKEWQQGKQRVQYESPNRVLHLDLELKINVLNVPARTAEEGN